MARIAEYLDTAADTTESAMRAWNTARRAKPILSGIQRYALSGLGEDAPAMTPPPLSASTAALVANPTANGAGKVVLHTLGYAAINGAALYWLGEHRPAHLIEQAVVTAVLAEVLTLAWYAGQKD